MEAGGELSPLLESSVHFLVTWNSELSDGNDLAERVVHLKTGGEAHTVFLKNWRVTGYGKNGVVP